MENAVKPYGNKEHSKKEEVKEMFDNISAKYDFLNHFFSMGIDKLWRKKAVNLLKDIKPKKIIDIASGTGDFAIALYRLNAEEIIGFDLSQRMLDKGIEKIKKYGYDNIIKMQQGDSENIPFPDEYFDALTVGFGVRNFENLEKGLSEMLRVVKKGGRLVILEFSKPKKNIFGFLFSLYSKYGIPTIGKLISKDKRAYSYLPESVAAFPEGENFKKILEKLSYKDVKIIKLSGGIASIYFCTK